VRHNTAAILIFFDPTLRNDSGVMGKFLNFYKIYFLYVQVTTKDQEAGLRDVFHKYQIFNQSQRYKTGHMTMNKPITSLLEVDGGKFPIMREMAGNSPLFRLT